MMIDDNMEEEESNNDEVKYSDKDQQTALLLSIFLGGFAAGRFYIGDYIWAGLKLTIAICFLVYSPIMVWLTSGDGKKIWVFPVLWLFICVVLMIWIIYDIVEFALNDITDGNGLTLQPM